MANEIGSFDERIELLKCLTDKGPKGEKVETYVTSRNAYGHVDLSASEDLGDYNVESEGSIVVTMYKTPGLDTRWRIRWRGKLWNIIRMEPISRISPFIRITAEETR